MQKEHKRRYMPISDMKVIRELERLRSNGWTVAEISHEFRMSHEKVSATLRVIGMPARKWSYCNMEEVSNMIRLEKGVGSREAIGRIVGRSGETVRSHLRRAIITKEYLEEAKRMLGAPAN